jgi:hypothetical protein
MGNKVRLSLTHHFPNNVLAANFSLSQTGLTHHRYAKALTKPASAVGHTLAINSDIRNFAKHNLFLGRDARKSTVKTSVMTLERQRYSAKMNPLSELDLDQNALLSQKPIPH